MGGNRKTRVVIAGGGVAALETVLALKPLIDTSVEIELIAPEREFVYAPMTVAEPFGVGFAQSFSLESIARDLGFHLRRDSLVSIDPLRRRVVTDSGADLGYDRLVIAVGARRRRWLRGALHFDGRAAGKALREVMERIECGEVQRVVFAAPPGTAWSLPLYELAMLTRAYATNRGAPVPRLVIVTPEARPLEVFGDEASSTVERLLTAHDIELWSESYAAYFDRPRLQVIPDGVLFADETIALPSLEGRAFTGLLNDRHGFVRVDEYGAVPGVDGVYAAGDGAAHPVKQGGLAAQEADSVALALASSLGAPVEPMPFRPTLRGLLLDDSPTYLRSEGDRSVADAAPLWWPPSKISARYLGPYLAGLEPALPSAAP